MPALLSDLLFDYTLRTVALGSATIGVVSGALGAFAVLRRQSLLGDAVSHTALPGIVLAFMLTASKASGVLLLGAALAGGLATAFVSSVARRTRVKYDTALGIALSVFFGFGLVLLTFVQKQPDARQAGLDRFLFGQASSLVGRDVLMFAVVAAVVLAMVLLFWKEFKLLAFDPAFGASMGLAMPVADFLLTTLLVFAIVLGLQTVGVVLMSAMVVAPAVAARQWTDRLGPMVMLSAGAGALAGVTGALLSSTTARLPTGPTIVVCVSALVIASLLFAPHRGLVWNHCAQNRRRRRLAERSVLLDLYELSLQHEAREHPHAAAVLRSMSLVPRGVGPRLRDLERRGWVRREGRDAFALTAAGRQEALRALHLGQTER